MGNIPDFQTLDQLIEFWEEHDFAEHWDEFEEVGAEEAAPDYSHRVTIALPLDVLLDAIERLSVEDARQVYKKISERLNVE
jgi:hypothetical protein